MNRFNYLLYKTFLKIQFQKKQYILYIVCFYVGLLLPACCIANIRSVDQVIYFTTYEGMEQSVKIDWFSERFIPTEFELESQYFVSAIYEEEFREWNHQYVTIKGIDENYAYPIPQMDGRVFVDEEYENGSNVCLISKQHAEKYNCRLGDKISIRGTEVEVIGIGENKLFTGMYLPLETMRNIYQEEKIQFSCNVFVQNEKDKMEITEEISNQIERADENAEILYVVDGDELYRDALVTKTQWRVVRGTIAIIAVLFFVLNEAIVLSEKIKGESLGIGINMAMGATQQVTKRMIFIETFFITIIASIMVLLSVMPLARWMSLDNILIIDSVVIIIFLIIAIVACELLTWFSYRKIKTRTIAEMLKMRNE